MTTRMVRSSSLASLNENELNLESKPTQPKFTDKIFGIINFISLIPTLAYNIVWLFILKNVFENEDSFLESLRISDDCSKLYWSLNTAFFWVVISLLKSIFFLLCARMICGSEIDCSFLCLLLKAITSYFPSIYFTYAFEYSVEISREFIASLENKKCEKLVDYAQWFYTTERAYFIFFSILIGLIPVGSILVGLKELWKSKGYIKSN
jgi:hypothetical protein